MPDNAHLSGLRRKKIAELVEERGAVAVRDLVEQFGKSEATIRRDLRKLGESGAVTRTHGGVMMRDTPAPDIPPDIPNEQRMQVRPDEKRRIGRAAIDMLAGGEVVFLDAGTTALCAADNAHLKPECCYVTTCLGVASRLRAQRIERFFVIGGAYREVNDSFTGALAIAALRSLSFDIAFLCCTAIDTARGTVAVRDEAYSQVQKEAIASSRRNFVIADHGKFDTTAFMRTAGFEELDGIVTNQELNRDILGRLSATKLEIVLA